MKNWARTAESGDPNFLRKSKWDTRGFLGDEPNEISFFVWLEVSSDRQRAFVYMYIHLYVCV